MSLLGKDVITWNQNVNDNDYSDGNNRVSAANSEEISIYFNKYLFGQNKYFLAYFWEENKYILAWVSLIEKVEKKVLKKITPKNWIHKLISILTSVNFCSVLNRTNDFK